METLLIDQIQPNDWNPNQMSEEEFAELVAEVRHLGKVPKPIVLRKNGAGYEIVDGEHTYRALLELDYEELQPSWFEVEAYDDFEAMRQTYKRNQHGTHDPVRQGQLFERMRAEKNLSVRALADEVELSEGTIRNSLEYSKAAKVRNDYAFSNLGVKQVRAYNRLPQILADFWLESTDADLKALYLNKHQRTYYGYHDSDWVLEQTDAEDFSERITEIFGPLLELLPHLRTSDFDKAIKRLSEIKNGLRLGDYKVRLYQQKFFYSGWSVDVEEALPYIRVWLKKGWEPRHQGRFLGDSTVYTEWMRKVFNKICRVVDRKVRVVVPIDDFEVLLTTADFESIWDLGEALGLLVEATNPELKEQDPNEAIWELEVRAKAPTFIRESELTTIQKHKLWRAGQGYENQFTPSMIENAQRYVIEELEKVNPKIKEWGSDITAYAENASSYDAFRNPENRLGELLRLMLADQARATVEELRPFIEQVSKAAIGQDGPWEKLAVRLANLDEPELRLLGSYVLGAQQMGEVGFELFTPQAKERWLQEIQASLEK